MLKNYLKIAWRNLWKNKTESFVNITGLSIGMAAAVLIAMWVRNELSFDNYHPAADRIFLVTNHGVFGVRGYSPYPLAKTALEEIPEIENAGRLYASTYNPPDLLIDEVLFQEKKCAYVDQKWFQVFHYDFIEGSADDFNRYPHSLLLTASAAKKYFGAGSAIGKVIQVDSVDYQVRAVVKDNPANSSFDFEILMPLRAKFSGLRQKEQMQNWGRLGYLTFVRLRSIATTTKVEQKLTAIYRRNNLKNDNPGLLSLKEMHFDEALGHSSLSHGNRQVVYIFGIIAILLLLTASINYVNLTTARASLRVKEVSIKKIAGAGRWQLIGQLLSESALLSLLATLLAVCLVQSSLPFLNSVTGKSLSLTATYPWVILIVAFLGTILLTGIYPALLLSSFKPISIFRGLNMLNVKDTVLRKGLVIAQFSVSIVLIISTIVLYKQLHFIRTQDPGYNRSQVLSFRLPSETISAWKPEDPAFELFCQSMKQDLLSSSAIKSVSLMKGASIINHEGRAYGLDWEGRDPDFNLPITVLNIDPDFGEIVDLELAAGRWFREGSKADESNVILNETAVKELNIPEPVIGRRFYSGISVDENQVIGIVRDFHFRSLHEKIGPLVITSSPVFKNSFLVKVVPGRITPAIQDVKKTWNKFLKGRPFTYHFLDEEFEELYRSDRQSFILIGIFAGIAIFISCLGLFGLAAFSVIRRAREIGIRKVLGASVKSVMMLLSRDFIKLVLIAFAIAAPAAWYAMNHWLQDFAYRIDIEWWMLAIAGLLALGIALLTISFQSVKAALMNPVKSLRSE